MKSLKRFSEEKLPNKKCFDRSLKDGTTSDNGEKLNGRVSDKKIFNMHQNLELI